MFQIALYEPEIPPNTGNIMRLCANAGARLHLIEPLGFSLDDRQLRRAGLDYRDLAQVTLHRDYGQFMHAVAGQRVFACSTRAATRYTAPRFRSGDVLLFGPETRGLPADILQAIAEDRRLCIPMLPSSRSLNLSNAASIVLYEAWRQCQFDGAAPGCP